MRSGVIYPGDWSTCAASERGERAEGSVVTDLFEVCNTVMITSLPIIERPRDVRLVSLHLAACTYSRDSDLPTIIISGSAGFSHS